MSSILIVDDEEPVRRMLGMLLTRAGYTVRSASNGVEALEVFSEAPTDLIITDLIMPEKEGVEFIIDLRRSHPGVRIVAMSGGGRGSAQDYLSIAKALGASATVAKPFMPDEMLGVISDLLGKRGPGG